MIKAVIFDIDGVLIDSFTSNARYIKDLLRLAGYRFTIKQYKNLYHLPLYDVIKIATKLRGHKEIEKIHSLRHALPDRPQHYGHPIPYSLSTIRTLSKKYKIALVSNRLRENITGDYFVVVPGIQKYITTFLGVEDTKRHKPHPEPLLTAVQRLGVLPDECVYVGDAVTDFRAARAAHIHFIAYAKKFPREASYKIFSMRLLPRTITSLESSLQARAPKNR